MGEGCTHVTRIPVPGAARGAVFDALSAACIPPVPRVRCDVGCPKDAVSRAGFARASLLDPDRTTAYRTSQIDYYIQLYGTV